MPSSATSSTARSPSQRHVIVTCGGPGVALDVGDRLLGDAPQLALLQDRQPAGLLGAHGSTSRPLRSRTRSRKASSVVGEALRLGDVGAQVVEGVADLADDAADVGAQLVEGVADGLAPGAPLLHDAVELEGEVGERLADAVVEVAGDAGALLVGADGAEPAEPAGVVDGEGGGLDEAGQELDVPGREVVGVAVLDRQQADDRATGGEHGVEAEPALAGRARARRRRGGSAR